MADIFDELLGPNGAPPEQLIAALRRQRTLGQVGALSGDKSVARLGGGLYDDSVKQAQDLRDRRDREKARADQQAFAVQQQEMAGADRKSQREYQYAALKQAGEIARQGQRNAREIAGLRQAANGGSPFQKQRERKLADESVDWDTKGKINAQVAVQKLDSAISALDQPNEVGSSRLAAIPGLNWTRGLLDKEGVRVQQLSDAVTADTLRPILGGAFTEKDREVLQELAYDPRLDDKTNLEKLRQKRDYVNSMMRRQNDLFGQYRQDDSPNYGSPDTLTDDDIVRAIVAEGE